MTSLQKTLLIIKPDGMKKNIIGEIINTIEKNNLTIENAKITKLKLKTAKKFYIEHMEKPFYNELINFITSYKIMALIISGNDSINKIRNIIGATNYKLAKPETIRNKYGSSMTENVVHASDSIESAKREIFIIFNKK